MGGKRVLEVEEDLVWGESKDRNDQSSVLDESKQGD